MDDVKRVAVGNPATHLSEDEPSFGLMEVATRVDVVEEVTILSQFEHEKGLLFCLNNLKDLDDVRVLDPL